MRQIGLWSMVVLWFLHLLLGAGAFYAIIRLWPSRANPFIRRVAIYMHGTVIGAVMAIVLVFFARGVTLTWKFAIAWFAGTLLMDAVRVPLILYLCLGGDDGKATASTDAKSSGQMPPDFWRKEFREAVRDELDRRDAEKLNDK